MFQIPFVVIESKREKKYQSLIYSANVFFLIKVADVLLEMACAIDFTFNNALMKSSKKPPEGPKVQS